VHGFSKRGDAGEQAYGDCPFCSAEGRFYVNVSNGLWDCKKCDLSGNEYSFLEVVHSRNLEILKNRPEKISELAETRGILVGELRRWEIGWDGQQFTFPVYGGPDGRTIVDIRRYASFRTKKGARWQLRSTPGVRTGLLGSKRLLQRDRRSVYLCEGEWDAMTMEWLLRRSKVDAVAVAVPGASTFKREWSELFRDRDVVLCYDADPSGERGELKAATILQSVVSSLQFVHWPEGVPQGFDLRDFVSASREDGVSVRVIWKRFLLLTRSSPRTTVGSGEVCMTGSARDAVEKERGKKSRRGRAYRYSGLLRAYREYLSIGDDTALQVICGTFLANQLGGATEPLWMFIVGPPGSSKTELLMGFSDSESVYTTTTLTPHALISGAYTNGGADPSLLPRLDGKVLVIKDFTAILSMQYVARDEIFGILRDAYDGVCEKQFGTGVARRYESRFGIIAGVTPDIDRLQSSNRSLGERFLKYRLPSICPTGGDPVLAALQNLEVKVTAREGVRVAASSYLEGILGSVKELPEWEETTTWYPKLRALAGWTALLRGSVAREIGSDRLLHKPVVEYPTRLALQFKKLGSGISAAKHQTSVGSEEYHILKHVARDTVPDREEEILRRLWEASLDSKFDGLTLSELSRASRFPRTTVSRVMDNSVLLHTAKRLGKGIGAQYRASDRLISAVEKSGIWEEKSTSL